AALPRPEDTARNGRGGGPIEEVGYGRRPRPRRVARSNHHRFIVLKFCLVVALTRPAPVETGRNSYSTITGTLIHGQTLRRSKIRTSPHIPFYLFVLGL